MWETTRILWRLWLYGLQPRRVYWKTTILELSAWLRFCRSNPNPSAFGKLLLPVKNKLISDDPMTVCELKYPKMMHYIRSKGDLMEPLLMFAVHVDMGDLKCDLFVLPCATLLFLEDAL